MFCMYCFFYSVQRLGVGNTEEGWCPRDLRIIGRRCTDRSLLAGLPSCSMACLLSWLEEKQGSTREATKAHEYPGSGGP